MVLDPTHIRGERKLGQVCSEEEYTKVFDRLSTLPPRVEHLIIQLGDASPSITVTPRLNVYTGIPIAYPRMVFLENALSSKLNPFVSLAKSGSFGIKGFVNKFNGDAELLDDLVLIRLSPCLRSELIVVFKNDHWTSKYNKVPFFLHLTMFSAHRNFLG
jgi:hypothetical protein